MKNKFLFIVAGLLITTIYSFPLLAYSAPYVSMPDSRGAAALTQRQVPVISSGGGAGTTETPASPTTTSANLTCDGARIITLDIEGRSLVTQAQRLAAIQDPLNNFTSYDVGDAYKICFHIIKGSDPAAADVFIDLSAGVVFDRTATKPVLISGLYLKSASTNLDILTINTSSPVTLLDSGIQGIGGADEGACLVLQGSGHIVKKSKFHNCNEGIQIKGSNMKIGPLFMNPETRQPEPFDQVRFDAEKNEIYSNNIGIHWINGTGNRFSFNKIYNNPPATTTPLPDDAIIIDSTDIIRPDFVFKNEKAEEDQKALHCTVSKEGVVTSLFFQFDPAIALAGQEMIIYKSMLSHYQIEEYFAKCRIGEEGVCPIEALPPGYNYSYDAVNKECVISPEIRVIALINGADFTSMLTPQVPKSRGPIVALGGEDGIVIASSGSAATGEVTASGAAGDGGGGESAAVTTGGGSGGGCGGGGQSMAIVPMHDRNTIPPFLGLWWLIFTAPAVLVAVRIKKKK